MRTPKRAIAYLLNIIPIASMLIAPAMTFAQDENTSLTRRSWGYVFAGTQKHEKYSFDPTAPYDFKVDSTFQFSRAGGGWEWLTSEAWQSAWKALAGTAEQSRRLTSPTTLRICRGLAEL